MTTEIKRYEKKYLRKKTQVSPFKFEDITYILIEVT